jgi:hypothetical protein
VPHAVFGTADFADSRRFWNDKLKAGVLSFSIAMSVSVRIFMNLRQSAKSAVSRTESHD